MKGTKLLLSFWLSTAAFCLLQILFGPGGLTETSALRDQQVKLEARLEALKSDNLRLTARYESLRTSLEAVRLEARSLGWFQRGDIPVRTLDGAQLRLPPDTADLSAVPRLLSDQAETTLFFRLVWPILFASFWAFFSLLGRMWPSGAPGNDESEPLSRSLPVPLQSGLDFFRK